MTTPLRTGTLHLICNAHLDPAWQWDWQSGAAEALSTFRTAADLCEEFPDFIFCHNEALLYHKRAQQGEDLILRLFNPTAKRLASRVELPWLPARLPVALAPFALLTLRVAQDGQAVETDLLETPMIRKTGAST